MNITLESIGLSQEALANRVVEKLVEGLTTSLDYDEEGGEFRGASPFARKLNDMVKARLDALVNEMGEKHVLPRVTEMVENMVLQETNRWGEKVGQPVTFIEYMTQRADAWLREDVDFQGNTKDASGWSSFRKSGTRVQYMIDQHLQYTVRTAMENAVKNANQSIVGGLKQAVSIALDEVAAKLKVEVKTK
ncbi:MAG: hypothetical protein KF895_03245 [Parvibaculum sp.]|nr:hypothetical protein [Parvibaculum sp.]